MSLVKETGLVCAVHEYGTRNFQNLQGPQCGVSKNSIILKSVLQLSICDMHFDFCVV